MRKRQEAAQRADAERKAAEEEAVAKSEQEKKDRETIQRHKEQMEQAADDEARETAENSSIFSLIYNTIVSLIDGLYPYLGLKSDLAVCIASVTGAKLTKDLLGVFTTGGSNIMGNMGLMWDISTAGQEIMKTKNFGTCQPIVDELENIANLPADMINYAKGIVSNFRRHLLDG